MSDKRLEEIKESVSLYKPLSVGEVFLLGCARYLLSLLPPPPSQDDLEVAREVVVSALKKYGPIYPSRLPHRVDNLIDAIAASRSSAREAGEQSEWEKWNAAISPNYCSSTNPAGIMEMHDREIEQRGIKAERERIRGAVTAIPIAWKESQFEGICTDDVLKAIDGGEVG